MRYMPVLALALALILALEACGAEPAPTPTIAPAPTLPTVGEILAAPTPGPIRTVGFLHLMPEGALLVSSLSLEDTSSMPLGAALWIDPPPTLPGDAAFTDTDNGRYFIVEVTGRLEGPEGFGPGGRYPYRLVDSVIEPRSARELSIPLLLDNSTLYEGQPIRLRGQLLASPDSALLAESLGAGGVPEAGARLIKLDAPPQDPGLTAALRSSGDGRVTFGPVEVIGLWRAGRLYPLAVRPQ